MLQLWRSARRPGDQARTLINAVRHSGRVFDFRTRRPYTGVKCLINCRVYQQQHQIMATTRLRKTFHYPSESDSEPDELDEEHQEKLIASFQAEDAQKNELYRNAFLSIPLISTLFFLYMFVVASTARQRLIALLSISSMISAAYILKFMPIEAPARKGKRPVYQVEADKGPVQRYMVYLNAAQAGLLLLAALVSWRKGLGDDAWREALPASK